MSISRGRAFVNAKPALYCRFAYAKMIKKARGALRMFQRKRAYAMKKCMILLLLLFLTGCSIKPAWIAPSFEPLRTPVPTQEQKTPEPVRFNSMKYIDSLMGGGHNTEGSTIVLGRDIVLTNPIYLAGYKALVIDLNGHKIRYEPEDIKSENEWKDSALIFDESSVTLCSSLPGGTIECETQTAITGITAMDHSALLIENVDIALPKGLDEASCGIYITTGAYAEIDGGSISASCAVFADDPTQEGTTLVINSGNIGDEGSLTGAYAKDTATVIINGGTFTGSVGGLYAQGNPYVSVYNGSFNIISDFAQSGWMPELGKGAVWETVESGTIARREA